MGDRTTAVVGRRMRLRPGALRALRVLEVCSMLPADAFGPIVGLASQSGAYKQLARLRSGGLADVRDEDLGFLFGGRRCGLWSITDLGHRMLNCARERDGVNWPPESAAQSLPKRQLPLRVASYWLLAWFMVEAREHGQAVAVQAWECPWVSEFQPAEDERCVRVRLPAAAYIVWEDAPHPEPSSGRRLLLLPDLGTAPVARYREMLRRVLVHIHNQHQLLVATTDPDGRGIRAAVWRTHIARVARREQLERPAVRVVSWSQVSARVGGSVKRALVGQRRGTTPSPVGRSGRDQVLHLVGRHPLLTVRQLADLLGAPRGRIERFERELIERDLLRALDDSDLGASGLDLDALASSRLGLVEVTDAGRRRLADMLGLDAPTARRYHGLTGSGRATTARRRRFLRTLAHTVGTNDIFVAFALAAAETRRRGGSDELSEWRASAACERQWCKPDGYGLYTREGVGYGFLLEFDRGTESARKYAAKFGAYYRYRDSGQAARDYDGLPTILFITTSVSAEDRIARQAYRAWFARSAEPLRVLLTTTERISGQPEGILGPIWRLPAEAPGDGAQRSYWLPTRS